MAAGGDEDEGVELVEPAILLELRRLVEVHRAEAVLVAQLLERLGGVVARGVLVALCAQASAMPEWASTAGRDARA
jgi:hypothetical protein